MTNQLDDRRPGLPPPRFRLATLFWAIAVLGLLFAAMSYLGSHSTLIVILFALAVFAHVAGNALGTRLRANGDQPVTEKGIPIRPIRMRRRAEVSDFAPTTKLSDRAALGRPALIATVVGAIVVGTLGGVGLTLIMKEITIQGVLLAVVASAVLGGFWTFLAASLIQVFFGAAWQATKPTGRK